MSGVSIAVRMLNPNPIREYRPNVHSTLTTIEPITTAARTIERNST